MDDGYRDETDWHKVVAFDWVAKRASERLRKGHAVAVVGTIRPKTWKDQEGKTRKNVEIYAENLCFSPLPSRDEQQPVEGIVEEFSQTRAVDPPAAKDCPMPEKGEVPF
jgi:single-strand DNA-binding protein